MVLSNKKVLIISPEAWGKIFISKHHYALTLAELGNIVYFLNPIDYKLANGFIKIENTSLSKNIFIVTYRPFFPWILKFHAKWLFEILIKLQINKILKKINTRIDIVWDFTCDYLYNDLSIFKAGIKIFHPVDMLRFDPIKKKTDIIFSVSPLILKTLNLKNTPGFLINHGLSKDFDTVLYSDNHVNNNDKIKVCYIGNLLIENLDRNLIKDIILTYKEVDFFFIGPYSNNDNNIQNEFNQEDNDFISFLKDCSNVTLTGTLSGKEIADKIISFDAFLICYKNSRRYKCDNSHKVIEYLSTGKVVVSTPILFYENSDLIEMSKSSEDFKVLFNTVIKNLPHYNSIELNKKRKAFAKNNTYLHHIKNIEGLINREVLHLADNTLPVVL